VSREDEIRQRVSEATPGPWHVLDHEEVHSGQWVCSDKPRWFKSFYDGHKLGGTSVCEVDADPSADWSPKDATLIANAPSDLTYLLDRLAERDATIDGLREECDSPGHPTITGTGWTSPPQRRPPPPPKEV
jgi:hypothetical protein